ncbi:MAG: class B sortase [Oscillospiraceae bacterium]|nr:class B sortase [Oscillospiraceae bacterium]
MKRWLNNLLLIIFSIVFIVSLWLLIDYYAESRKQKDTYDDLASLVDQYRPVSPTSPTVSNNSTGESADDNHTGESPDATAPSDGNTGTQSPSSNYVEMRHPVTGETIQVLPEYARIFTLNSDLVGWIRIDGTVMNYPVMQTPDRSNYYLKRDFNKTGSAHGCIYASEDCDITQPSDNITIYGHNMRDGSMFATLLNYKKESFWVEHPVIHFDTLTKRHSYEVMAVFTTTASVGFGFDYHNFIDAADEDAFYKFVSDCKLLSLYDTGVDAEYGDKFITLSTCEYSQANGRMVIVARRIG